jgi:hypothetical protein
MIGLDQLLGESAALQALMADPRFSEPSIQRVLACVLNELAWVSDVDEAMPISQILLEEREVMQSLTGPFHTARGEPSSPLPVQPWNERPPKQRRQA